MKNHSKYRFYALGFFIGFLFLNPFSQTTQASTGDSQNATSSQSIQNIGTDLSKINNDIVSLKNNIISQFENGISQSIASVSSSKKISPESINKSIQVDRSNFLKFLDDNFSLGAENVLSKSGNIKDESNNALKKIAQDISEISRTDVSFDEVSKNIGQSISVFIQNDGSKFDSLKNQKVDLMYVDSDGDGVSDYDEIYIYHTDPYKANTAGGSLNDGQKILQGLNPLSSENSPIKYSSPETLNVVASSTYTVKDVSFDQNKKSVIFSGTALPNSFVTLYIFSTPIIVTVKSNALGQWTYSLNQELDNGDHKIYVASVDTAGKIVARGSLFPFIKTASAATLGEPIETPVENSSFNIILISVTIFIVLVIMMLLYISRKQENKIEK